MPDGQLPRYVSWDRWDAEHRALREREDEAHKQLADRIDDLERALDERKNRQWTLLITVLGALVLPLLATAIVALIAALHQ